MGVLIHRSGRSSGNTTPRRSRRGVYNGQGESWIRVLEVRHVLRGGPDAGILGLLGGLALLLEPALAVDGGPATVTGRRYSLAVAGVRDVTSGEHAGDARHSVVLLYDVAALFHLDLPLKERGCRSVPDGREEAADLDCPLLAGLRVPNAHPLDGVFAQDLLHDRVCYERDFRVLTRPFEHDLGRPELVAAVDQEDLVCELGEDAGLLHRCVPPADHGDLLAPVEERIARGAAADALTHQLLLALEPKPLGLGARGDHHGPCEGRLILIFGPQLERALREIDPLDVLGTHLGPETRGLGLEIIHHLGPHDPIPVPWIILYVGGQHELPAALETLEDEHLQARPRGVQGRRVPGRTRADYHDVICSLSHLKHPSYMQNL